MSWHIDNVGTKEQVTAAVDEALAANCGMPAAVGAYLKGAIAACGNGQPGALVYVRSVGHRPMESAGASELCEVKLMRSGPWNPK